MAGNRASVKRCVVALLPEEEEYAGEKISLRPCTSRVEAPLEHEQQCATARAAAEDDQPETRHPVAAEERRSRKRKAARGSKGSGGTLVPADGEEMILVPRGKLALSKKLVDKILSLERRTLPYVADLLKDDDPNPSEAEKALKKNVRHMARYHEKQGDKFVECQAMILRLRHAKGYAVVDNHLQVRMAVFEAGGILLAGADVADLIDEGFDLASN